MTTLCIIIVTVTTAAAMTWWLCHDNEPTCIELHTIWIVSGIVWGGYDSAYEPRGYAAEFTAPTRLDAIRQYGEHVRAAGMWVETIDDIMWTGVCTVRQTNPAA